MKIKSMPAVFVTDFGPFPAIETDDYTESLKELGKNFARPRAIVIMSGHWETKGMLFVTSSKRPGVIHDYSGFPEEFYRLDYPCPGDPELAEEMVELVLAEGISAKMDTARSLDHGAWVPLSRLYPKADIPTVQISVPVGNPRMTMEIGRILSPLREKGVLLVGSGALSHNLPLVFRHQKNDLPDSWALEFDSWISDKLDGNAIEDLLNYKALAPSVHLAAPTSEHFDPLFFMLGAARGESIVHFYRGIYYGNGLMKIFFSAGTS
jgi:4,5-DOPA dioxygenase extradiol